MPLKKKKSASKLSSDQGEGDANPLPPPPDTQPKLPAKPPLPSQQELAFNTQLAHGSQTKKIKDFTNVRELYHRIGEVFSISSTEVNGTVCVCVFTNCVVMRPTRVSTSPTFGAYTT